MPRTKACMAVPHSDETGTDIMDAQAFVILSDLIIPLAKDRETVIERDNSKWRFFTSWT